MEHNLISARTSIKHSGLMPKGQCQFGVIFQMVLLER